MRVQVTQFDIDNGQKRHAVYCPVALGIRRTFPPVPHDELNTAVLYDYIVADNVWYKTPPEVREFMWQYDHDNPVQPFEFELVAEDIDKGEPE